MIENARRMKELNDKQEEIDSLVVELEELKRLEPNDIHSLRKKNMDANQTIQALRKQNVSTSQKLRGSEEKLKQVTRTLEQDARKEILNKQTRINTLNSEKAEMQKEIQILIASIQKSDEKNKRCASTLLQNTKKFDEIFARQDKKIVELNNQNKGIQSKLLQNQNRVYMAGNTDITSNSKIWDDGYDSFRLRIGSYEASYPSYVELIVGAKSVGHRKEYKFRFRGKNGNIYIVELHKKANDINSQAISNSNTLTREGKNYLKSYCHPLTENDMEIIRAMSAAISSQGIEFRFLRMKKGYMYDKVRLNVVNSANSESQPLSVDSMSFEPNVF